MVHPDRPALVLAPMDGITDAPMRALQGATGAFSYAVTEFIRVSNHALPQHVFEREVPELSNGALTSTGLPVQVQILGGDPDLCAASAVVACRAGATAIDLNFGCPAPTVNRHDGGASLLRHPLRIRRLVSAVRQALPAHIPVSAKLRLGWDGIEAIHENAAMAAEGGASWLTIHARTRTQGYAPPVYWKPIAQVRSALSIPIIANGDIWTLEHFQQCWQETGCIHYMLGRGALANPLLPYQIARQLGLNQQPIPELDWPALLASLVVYSQSHAARSARGTLMRLKQWLKIASNFGDFARFDQVKHSTTVEELLTQLAEPT
ncbi:tRNA-dihydrouridine synthase family protein [bacterium]|nr:tRNA-dihydrouridine synthase family protein [bacterium]